MSYYEGLSCPVCSKAFSSEDDVVVCPQCGLPHHRECWKSIGRCYEDANHGTEQQWRRDREQNKETNCRPASVMSTCPHCGSENAEYAEFCARCGYPLGADDWHSAPQQHSHIAGKYTPFGQTQETYTTAERIGECNAAELAAVVGNNARYYMDRFRRIQHSGAGGWNWAAFIFGPVWLFYRKQYGLGTLFMILQLMYGVASTVVYNPVQLAETQEAAEVALLAIINGPMFWMVAALSVILLALNILLAIRANNFYLRHCEKKIAKAKVDADDISAAELTAVGGVALGVAVLVYVLSSVVLEMISIMIATLL